MYGISNDGQVVGVASTAFVLTSFTYDIKKGTFTTLLPLPGAAAMDATGISEPGTIVGAALDAAGTESGFILNKKGRFTTFANPGWDNTEPRAVNNIGLVTGYSHDTAFTSFIGFIYDPTSDSFVEILPSPLPTIAQGINNRGQVVGSVYVLHTRYGWLRDTDGTMTRFRVNGYSTAARGITDSGIVAVYVVDVSGHTKGFVTTLAGVADLGSVAIPDAQLFEVPGAVTTVIEGITNSGAIAGSWNDGVNDHGYIATQTK